MSEVRQKEADNSSPPPATAPCGDVTGRDPGWTEGESFSHLTQLKHEHFLYLPGLIFNQSIAIRTSQLKVLRIVNLMNE